MWEWFERHWPWIGLVAAVVLLVVLFATNVFRTRDTSRWRDPVWLAWLMTVAYMLHNFEEYGMDAKGARLPLPDHRLSGVRLRRREHLPARAVVLRRCQRALRLVRTTGGAMWCRRNQAVGLTGAGLLFTNALSHIGGLFTPMGYSPGTLTAAVIFIPLSLWVFATQFGRGRLSYLMLAAILLAIILAQTVLLALLLGLSRHAIPLPLAIAIQTIDPVLLLLLPWVANRVWPSTPAAEPIPELT